MYTTYDIPGDIESYTHRVGRTAHAGNRGKAISLIDNGEDKRFLNRSLLLIAVLSK
jgi:superfamily II DNA/RNA helicase